MADAKIRPVAILGLIKINRIGDFIEKMRGIYENMKMHSDLFPAPVPDLDSFFANILSLEKAEDVVSTRVRGSVNVRNKKYNIVLADVHSLLNYVQNLSDRADSYLAALKIIRCSGFDIRKKRVISKPDLKAINTNVSGIVKLIAKSPGKYTANEWQMSTDNENWINLPSTMQAKTIIENLRPATIYYFRHRAILGKNLSNWSQAVQLVVT